MDKKKRLITSALPYVNNIPHLGNIVGCVLSADVFARYCRSAGYDTLYVCGTDEYGTATEIKAIEENTTPEEVCRRYRDIHRKVYTWFNILFDAFGRTSTEKHKEITQNIFLRLYKNGYIIEEEVEQLYDPKTGIFLADRYIEGTCPICGYEEARGDQCDACGKLLNATELKNPKSKISGTSPIIRKTKHLFLDLKKLQPEVEKWINERYKTWNENTYKEALGWLRKGLKKRDITRDLKWGVPVPLEEYKDKVFYVWFDAPIGYISITACNTEKWEEWWKKPKNVKLYQFMGKDNVPFHAIIFPATLIGTKETWTLVNVISATEYLTYEGGKFSKSRGIGVFGTDAIESGIPADVWRYYLLVNRPEKSDTDFRWEDFQDKINNELVANLGNLTNRVSVFITKYFGSKVGSVNANKIADVIPGYDERIEEITNMLENIELKEALRKIMEISAIGNKYFQENAPWKLIKEDTRKAEDVLCILANIVKDLGILIQPYMPETSKRIFRILNIKERRWNDLGNISIKNHEIGKPEILFRKLEDKEVRTFKERFSGKRERKHINAEDLRIDVGKIVSVKRHPNADKLYIEEVKVKDGIITLVSGLVPFFSEDELKGKHVLVLRNIKKANIRGVISEGMLLVAENKQNPKDIELLGDGLNIGDVLEYEGTKPNPIKTNLIKDIDIKEFLSLNAHIKDGILIIGGKKASVNGEYVKTKRIKNGIVR